MGRQLQQQAASTAAIASHAAAGEEHAGESRTAVDEDDDAEAKTSVFAFVTSSNDFTHVFWMEGVGPVQEVHYARVNNADPPALDTGGSDVVISFSSP